MSPLAAYGTIKAVKKTYTDLVVFLVPPEQFIGGGIISIFSLCRETREVVPDSTHVVISTYPGTPTYGKNTSFENDEVVYDFKTVIKEHPRLNSLIIHIPEYSVEAVVHGLNNFRPFLESAKSLQLNVLNQNIKMMPDQFVAASLFTFTQNVTQTTAHIRYTNQELADTYRIPTHLFSVRIDPSQYVHKSFEEKENIVLFSPDEHPLRQKLIDTVKQQTDFEVIELHDLTFEEYKAIIALAKFTVTFGEGMDGYFIESAYSDSIGFAAYNEDYFPDKAYLELPNVYPDYETMVARFIRDIKKLATDGEAYRSANHQTAKLLNKIYGVHFFKENVRRFYKHDYSFTPTKKVDMELLLQALAERDVRIAHETAKLADVKLQLETTRQQLNQEVGARNEEIQKLHAIADERLDDILKLRTSLSWRLTKPVRQSGNLLRKVKRRRAS